jgi:hypothetical protein
VSGDLEERKVWTPLRVRGAAESSVYDTIARDRERRPSGGKGDRKLSPPFCCVPDVVGGENVVPPCEFDESPGTREIDWMRRMVRGDDQ